MTNTARSEREDAFRADAARLVQTMRHHYPARHAPPEAMPLVEPVRHLAVLLEAGAPVDHVTEAALAVVDAYDWPSPDSAEGPVIDAAILAAVERLRDAIDALDALNGEV